MDPSGTWVMEGGGGGGGSLGSNREKGWASMQRCGISRGVYKCLSAAERL